MIILMNTLVRTFLALAVLLSLSPISMADDRELRAALFADEGAGERGINAVTEQLRESGIEVVHVKGNEIAEGILTGFDVVIFTGGSGSGQADALGEKGRENVREFVREGGGYIGICAGAYLACTGFSWGVGVLDAKAVSPKWRRGHGIVEMEITAAGEEIIGLPAKTHQVRYQNGPIIEPHGRDDIPPFETVAFFRSELAENDTPEGIMVNSPAIVRGTFGEGRVVVSSPHPESTDGLEGSFAPAAVRWATGGRAAPAVSQADALSR